jgi:hypothetical protein
MRKKMFFLFIFSAIAAATALMPRAATAQTATAPGMTGQMMPGKVELRDDYTIVVDGKVVKPDVPPAEMNGVIFVPIRFVGEALGAKVDWNEARQTVMLTWAAGTLELAIGDTAVKRSGSAEKIAAAPFLYGNRAMVPLKLSAQAAGYAVRETRYSIELAKPPAPAAGTVEQTQAPMAGGKIAAEDTLGAIKQKAKSDPITKKLKWYIVTLWAIAGLFWLVRTAGAFKSDEPNRFKDKILIGLVLGVAVPCIIIFMLSTWWAAAVAIVTCIVGLVSTEEYEEKLVTMAGTAQGVGLICTLFGLGLLIGPAIANRDIHAIGYGIYVKIEPTITGLSLSIIMNMLFGYEARKQRTN